MGFYFCTSADVSEIRLIDQRGSSLAFAIVATTAFHTTPIN